MDIKGTRAEYYFTSRSRLTGSSQTFIYCPVSLSQAISRGRTPTWLFFGLRTSCVMVSCALRRSLVPKRGNERASGDEARSLRTYLSPPRTGTAFRTVSVPSLVPSLSAPQIFNKNLRLGKAGNEANRYTRYPYPVPTATTFVSFPDFERLGTIRRRVASTPQMRQSYVSGNETKWREASFPGFPSVDGWRH